MRWATAFGLVLLSLSLYLLLSLAWDAARDWFNARIRRDRDDEPGELGDNVVSPHVEGPVECGHCGWRWTAVRPLWTPPWALVCPKCGCAGARDVDAGPDR